MKIDGIEMANAGVAKGFRISYGTVFPTAPGDGELFHVTGVDGGHQPGLYVWNSTLVDWVRVDNVSTMNWSGVTNTPTTASGYGITSIDNVSIGVSTPGIGNFLDLSATSLSVTGSLSNFKTATFATQVSNATTSGSVTIDWTQGQNQIQVQPTGAITYTFTAPPGPCHMQLTIDSSGTSTAQVITWPVSVIWFGIPWAGINNKKSIINFWYDGTSYYAMGVNQV